MKLLYTIILGILFLSACKTSDDEVITIPFEEQAISASEKIKLALSTDYLSEIGINEEEALYLNTFYKSRNFDPVWINDSSLTTLGLKFEEVIKQPTHLSIPNGRYAELFPSNFVQQEMVNSISLSKIIHDLQNGLIDYQEKKKRPIGYVESLKLNEYVDFNEDEDLRLQFLSFGTNDSSYQSLGRGLIQLHDTYRMDTSVFNVESIKKDTAKAIVLATQALASKGYISEDADTAQMFAALKIFQVENGLKPDAVIGKYTSKALNESTTHKRDRIILAMDKIRTHDSFPDKYIHINIPEYKLRFYINDSLKSDHNIVVGKYKNQTPELRSKLRRIVAYPYWNVPYSISSKEILPSAKRSAEYFAKHNYKIYKKGEEVDPLTVDWSRYSERTFPYKVVQDPGRKNSLGTIKFLFPNEHSVYFHDTPSKSLFSVDVRAYSHGCMRTQNPVDLARNILERDVYGSKINEIESDSLDSIMARGQNRVIPLLKSIPVYIEYVTVARKGTDMIMYLDIYGRDEEYLKILCE
ncbi:MAG: L,D-transpeptidase family protein [Crocinitomicaceae bacterium]|nr:L,D-transpeptidase family protein [Crocinitomicaceae bacterium]